MMCARAIFWCIVNPSIFYKVSVINKIAIKLLGIDERTILVQEIWLILPEATAIGVRLSHASRKKLDSLHTAQ